MLGGTVRILTVVPTVLEGSVKILTVLATMDEGSVKILTVLATVAAVSGAARPTCFYMFYMVNHKKNRQLPFWTAQESLK